MKRTTQLVSIIILGSAALVFSLCGLRTFADECSQLELIPIKPIGQSKQATCNPLIDKFDCYIKAGYSHFGTVQTKLGQAFTIAQIPTQSLTRDEMRYLNLLKRSKIIPELNKYQILARKIVKSNNICEPNLIYVGKEPIFRLGPAFVDSTYFKLAVDTTTANPVFDGKIYTHVVLFENAFSFPDKKRAFFGMSMTREDFINHSYFDMAFLHETAHGIMQDIYGVEGFSKLYAQFYSRDGHMASYVTDPALAWFDGWAEGFEAFFGEKFLTPSQKDTAEIETFITDLLYLPKVRDQLINYIQQNEGKHGKVYNDVMGTLVTLGVAGEGISLARNASKSGLMAAFIKHERLMIPENPYVLKGIGANLFKYMDLLPENFIDTGVFMENAEESDQAIISKEGATGYLIYSILKAGLFQETVRLLEREKPMNTAEFVNGILKNWPSEYLKLIASPLKALYTQKGRQLTRDYLLNQKTVGNSLETKKALEQALRTIELPKRVPTPKDLWIEFRNPPIYTLVDPQRMVQSVVRTDFFGQMDRINLATASEMRIFDFINSVFDAVKRDKDLDIDQESFELLPVSFMDTLKKHTDVNSVEELAKLWVDDMEKLKDFGENKASRRFVSVSPEMEKLVKLCATALVGARQCFKTKCLSTPVAQEALLEERMWENLKDDYIFHSKPQYWLQGLMGLFSKE